MSDTPTLADLLAYAQQLVNDGKYPEYAAGILASLQRLAQYEADTVVVPVEPTEVKQMRMRAFTADKQVIYYIETIADLLRRETVAKEELHNWKLEAADEIVRQTTLRVAAEAERDALKKDAERLDYFDAAANKGECPALLCDDDGRWAVTSDGIQNVPMGEGAQDIQTFFDVSKDQWRDTPRIAIDAAMGKVE